MRGTATPFWLPLLAADDERKGNRGGQTDPSTPSAPSPNQPRCSCEAASVSASPAPLLTPSSTHFTPPACCDGRGSVLCTLLTLPYVRDFHYRLSLAKREASGVK